MLATLMAAVLFTPEPAFHAEFALEPGVRYELRLRETREVDGRITRDSPGRVMLELQPRDGADLLLVTVDPGENAVNESQARALGLALADFSSTAHFAIDDNHELSRLENWEAMRDQALRVATATVNAQIASVQGDRDTADKAIALLRSMMDTHDGMFSIFAKRIGPYMFGYGWELHAGVPIIQEAMFAVPYSPDPVASTLTTVLADDPKTERLIEYEMIQSLDTEAVRAIANHFLANVDGQVEVNELMKQMQIDVKTQWAYSIDLKAIARASITRTTRMPDQPLAIERWTWELVTAP